MRYIEKERWCCCKEEKKINRNYIVICNDTYFLLIRNLKILCVFTFHNPLLNWWGCRGWVFILLFAFPSFLLFASFFSFASFFISVSFCIFSQYPFLWLFKDQPKLPWLTWTDQHRLDPNRLGLLCIPFWESYFIK